MRDSLIMCVVPHMSCCRVSGGDWVVCVAPHGYLQSKWSTVCVLCGFQWCTLSVWVGGGWGGSGGQTWGLGVVGAKSRWRDWFKRGLGMIAMGVIC